MNREIAKSKVQSRDCHCVKGKDRDNNYDAVIDEVFDWHEKEVKNLTIHDVSVSFTDRLFKIAYDYEYSVSERMEQIKTLLVNER